jgi:agmatinase
MKNKIFQYSELYFITTKEFAGLVKKAENSRFVILGAPYDSTTTYRPGTRFAPSSIREASINIETFCNLAKEYLEHINFYDAGDLDVIGLDIHECLRRVSVAVEDIHASGRYPVIIGGEHTITYAPIRSIRPDLIMVFDAHLDLRDEYPHGMKISHATVMRRIYEDLAIKNIVYIGSRAWSKEEHEFSKKINAKVFDVFWIRKNMREVIDSLKLLIKKSEKYYISFDMDVIDPSHAPGVSNPEPNGLYTYEIFSILNDIVGEKLAGFDLVEVCPSYDNGITSILAAKILQETIALWNKSLTDQTFFK